MKDLCADSITQYRLKQLSYNFANILHDFL